LLDAFCPYLAIATSFVPEAARSQPKIAKSRTVSRPSQSPRFPSFD
jgi:hypothetical protein